MLAGGAALAAGAAERSAGEARIGRLIDAGARPADRSPSASISFPRALRGTRYQGYTLIGGPRRPEQFVVRDDAFDCVTYCETVLAAAHRARPRRIRDGAARDPLSQRHRELVRAQSLFLRVGPAQCREQDLPLARHGRRGRHRRRRSIGTRALGRRRFAMPVIPRATFLANKAQARDRRHCRLRHAGGRIWIISTSALSPSATTANCCCGMPSQSQAPRARRTHGPLSRCQPRALRHAAAAGKSRWPIRSRSRRSI